MAVTTAAPLPRDIIVCEGQILKLSCPDTEVITGTIVAGYNDHGVCEFVPDNCNSDHFEQEHRNDIFTCLWNQSICGINVSRFPSTVLTGYPKFDRKCRFAYNYMTTRNFNCIPSM